MLKKLLSILCLTAITTSMNCMQDGSQQYKISHGDSRSYEQFSDDTSEQLQEDSTIRVFIDIVNFMEQSKEDLAIQVINDNQDLHNALFLETTDGDGNSLLNLAVSNHCWKVAKVLINLGAPDFLKNNQGQAAATIPCKIGDDCQECCKRLDNLVHFNEPYTLTGIKRLNGDLLQQFTVAMQYKIDLDEVGELINNLIKANEFIKAKNLISKEKKFSLNTFLQSLLHETLELAINKWIEDPQNNDIQELVKALLVKCADCDNAYDPLQVLDGYPDLLEKYLAMKIQRNVEVLGISPQTAELGRRIPKARRSTSNTTVAIAGLGILAFAGFILYKIYDSKTDKKK